MDPQRLTLIADLPARYVGADAIITSHDPEVHTLARSLRQDAPGDMAFSRAAFTWVRDQIAHAIDTQDRRITFTAVDVLRERVGLCFSKAHLYAALLRAEGIPAGLCYQRLRDSGGHVLRGLVAIYLHGGWHRQDVRGNTDGLHAEFSLEDELAWTPDPAEVSATTPASFPPLPRPFESHSNQRLTLSLCAREGFLIASPSPTAAWAR